MTATERFEVLGENRIMLNEMKDVLDAAHSAALRFEEGLDTRLVGATAGLAELRSGFCLPLNDEPIHGARVLEELVAAAEPGLVASAGGRFFAWVIGGAVPASVGAEWMTSVWDQNAAMYACSPAAGVAEEAVGPWLKELLGLPEGASFALTSGCQMAHVTCLIAARRALLMGLGWDVEKRGLAGAPAIRVLAGGHGHGSIERAVRILGLGTDSLMALSLDETGTLNPETLRAALAIEGPAIVLLQAGEINTGTFDRFAELIPVARAAGAWVHVDGAFGMWAQVSERTRHLLRGIELADSWATDGHKWLNVSYDSGFAFVADPAMHRGGLGHRAAYLTDGGDARDQIDWNPEWSRRARGFAVWATLRQLGRHGVTAMIENSIDRTRQLLDGCEAMEGAEVVCRSEINQGLVRFGDDARTEAVIADIERSGEAFFRPSSWRGMRVMRVSVCGWRTTERDVDRALAAIEQAMMSKNEADGKTHV